jgi:hypothetical protein
MSLQNVDVSIDDADPAGGSIVVWAEVEKLPPNIHRCNSLAFFVCCPSGSWGSGTMPAAE